VQTLSLLVLVVPLLAMVFLPASGRFTELVGVPVFSTSAATQAAQAAVGVTALMPVAQGPTGRAIREAQEASTQVAAVEVALVP
jgi:hypothetical protein